LSSRVPFPAAVVSRLPLSNSTKDIVRLGVVVLLSMVETRGLGCQWQAKAPAGCASAEWQRTVVLVRLGMTGDFGEW
jgi:hypothetical protein